jgi:uncharacterized protein YjiS (DUF1127 family)
MSTTNTTIAMPGSYAVRMLGTMSALFMAGFAACRTWQRNRDAIRHLRSMSDAELRDIGIVRESIEPAVMGGRGSIHLSSGIY